MQDNWQLPALAEHGKQDLFFLPQPLMVFIKPLNQKPLSVPAFLLTLQNCRYQTDSWLFWCAHKVGKCLGSCRRSLHPMSLSE